AESRAAAHERLRRLADSEPDFHLAPNAGGSGDGCPPPRTCPGGSGGSGAPAPAARAVLPRSGHLHGRYGRPVAGSRPRCHPGGMGDVLVRIGDSAPYIWMTFLFLLGTAVGSFLNVCVARLPLEKSILWPGSRCSNCLQPIRRRDNIPVLSYLLLRGRCR